MGVYAEIVDGGCVGVGDPVRPFPGGTPGVLTRFLQKARFFGRQGWIYVRARFGGG
jgi:hypothetical protein